MKLLFAKTNGDVDQAVVDIALDKYSNEKQTTMNYILKKDEKVFSTNEEDRVIYRKNIALLASGLSLPPEDLMTSPIFLPWTMLKMDSNGHIQVVSEFLKNLCQKFLMGQSPQTLLEMVSVSFLHSQKYIPVHHSHKWRLRGVAKLQLQENEAWYICRQNTT